MAGLTSGTHRVTGDAPGSLTATHRGTTSNLETALDSARTVAPREPASTRPRWLLPVILALAVILVIMLVVAAWS